MWIPDPRLENPASLQPLRKPLGRLAVDRASPLSAGLIGAFPFGHQHKFENIARHDKPLVPVYQTGLPDADRFILSNRGLITTDNYLHNRKLDFELKNINENTAERTSYLLVFDSYRNAVDGTNRDIVLISNNNVSPTTDHYLFVNNSLTSGEFQSFATSFNTRFRTGINVAVGNGNTQAVLITVDNVNTTQHFAYNFFSTGQNGVITGTTAPGGAGFNLIASADNVSFLNTYTRQAPGKNFYGECFFIAVWNRALTSDQALMAVRNPYQFLIPA